MMHSPASARVPFQARASPPPQSPGGEEFVVVLGDLATERIDAASQAEFFAQKVRDSLSAPYPLRLSKEGQTESRVVHRCTASIGVVLIVNHDATQDEVLKSADSAMYQDKGARGTAARTHQAREGQI
jgi:diguanylate cyclase (GGDEF)-like protein